MKNLSPFVIDLTPSPPISRQVSVHITHHQLFKVTDANIFPAKPLCPKITRMPKSAHGSEPAQSAGHHSAGRAYLGITLSVCISDATIDVTCAYAESKSKPGSHAKWNGICYIIDSCFTPARCSDDAQQISFHVIQICHPGSLLKGVHASPDPFKVSDSCCPFSAGAFP